jgi:hypothetical protein
MTDVNSTGGSVVARPKSTDCHLISLGWETHRSPILAAQSIQACCYLVALILLRRGNVGLHLAIFLPAYLATGVPLAQDIERIIP